MTVSSEFRLFRQPKRIGDTLENHNGIFLIVGIEKFEILSNYLKIWYSCQNLEMTDYVSYNKAYKNNYQLEVEAKLKFDDERLKTSLYLGSIHLINNQFYKLTEYTDIKLDSTDLQVTFNAKPIHPLNRNEAKAKLIDTRKKKLQLQVF